MKTVEEEEGEGWEYSNVEERMAYYLSACPYKRKRKQRMRKGREVMRVRWC